MGKLGYWVAISTRSYVLRKDLVVQVHIQELARFSGTLSIMLAFWKLSIGVLISLGDGARYMSIWTIVVGTLKAHQGAVE
ncbi:hypothetical protein V6N13_046383 [Hibiscus sabdariffa]